MTADVSMEVFPGLDNIVLSSGPHTSRADGLCAMEAVAWMAGEEHSYNPECVDCFLASLVTGLNDSFPDWRRQELTRYLPRLIGTAKDGLRLARAFVFADWAVRDALPMFLLHHADGFLLRSLAPIVDVQSLRAAGTAIVRAAATLRSGPRSGLAHQLNPLLEFLYAANVARKLGHILNGNSTLDQAIARDQARALARVLAFSLARHGRTEPYRLLDGLLPMPAPPAVRSVS